MKSQLKVVVSVVALFATGAFAACGSSGNGGAGSKDGGPPKTEEAGAPDGSSEAAGPPQSIYVVPSQISDLSGVTFFTHPWPSDIRRDANGFILVAGVNNPYAEPLITDYINAVAGEIDGFSVAAPGYFLFNQDIDPTTLPASPPDTLSSTATVQLINVDPSSPEHDQRFLAQTYWRQAVGDYWQADTLVVGPALGYTLLPSTKYAVVVTTGVKTPGGLPFAPSPDLRQVLGLDTPTPITQAAHDLFAPAVADLAALGIAASSIAHFTVFTTNDPTSELFSITDDLKNGVFGPAPTILPAQLEDGGFDEDAGASTSLVNSPGDIETGIYDVYYAWYGPAPNFQQGTPPYTNSGGNFVFSNGHAVLQNTFPMRITLVIPNATACPMPANGYPVLMYAHGSGGDYQSVIYEGNSVGDDMARQCIASMGTDEIFSGARPGAPPANDPNLEGDEDAAFFNFGNPDAMRTNTRQSAIDIVEEERLFTQTKITIPASVSVTGATISFDPTKVLFMGHSQGSLSGPPYLAADGNARGAVLSGASSSVPITLLDKTNPPPSIAALWKIALGLTQPVDAAELNIFHPIMGFAQTVVDPIDPLVYMRYLVRTPRPGNAPKSIYQTEGIYPDGGGDTYAPPHGIEVGSAAIGLPLQTPVIHPRVEAPWGGYVDGLVIQDGGLSGNLADGSASGVLGQFEPAPNDDGHFVFFDVPACHLQAAQFAKNLAANPVGNVPPASQ
jgi:hypothetical protein